METLKLFLLFSTVLESACFSLKHTPIETNDFFELLRKSAELDGFSRALEATYEKREFKALYAGTTTVKFAEVARNLNGMISIFMRHSVEYMGRYLIEYCHLAVWLLHRNVDGPRAERRVREELRFPDDRVYCVITAIHDYGLYVDRLFEGVFFFRTIDRLDRYPLDDMKAMLIQYLKFLKSYYALPQKYKHFRPRLPSGLSFDGIVRRLDAVKRKLANFSNMFCSRWTPIVSNAFLTKTVYQEVRNESRFVRYVFFNEQCRITHGDILKENMTTSWWKDYPYSVSGWIWMWNCGNILGSQEYGFKEYEDSVKPEKEFSCAEFLLHITARVFPTVTIRSRSRRTEPRVEPEETVKSEFSLAELKEQLTPNNYYLNVLIYYNIVSDVMLMASIKEGVKVIKGIKLVAQWSCSKINKNTVDTIRGLRPTLSAFKLVFDEFVDMIQNEKRVDVNSNAQKKVFEKRVDELMPLLDVRDDPPARQFCDKIIKQLEDTNVDGRAYPVGNPIGVPQFRGYYFVEPILHVGQLHRFSASGYKYDETGIVPE